MLFIHDDGGRAAAGFKGTAGDCAVRAVAIATGVPYRDVYDRLNAIAATERGRIRTRGNARRLKRGLKPIANKSQARDGVWPETMKKLLDDYGWEWTPTMGIGTGCRVHMRPEELPAGRIIVRVAKHYAAVIDGQLRDIFDCTRGGDACVYGYWSKP